MIDLKGTIYLEEANSRIEKISEESAKQYLVGIFVAQYNALKIIFPEKNPVELIENIIYKGFTTRTIINNIDKLVSNSYNLDFKTIQDLATKTILDKSKK